MIKNGYVTKDGFIVVGHFDEVSGAAEGEVSAELGEIHTLRIHVLSTSQAWVILNEVRTTFGLNIFYFYKEFTKHSTVVSRYYDTAGIGKKYYNIQTIELSRTHF